MIAILGAGSMGRLWAATLPAGQVAFVPRPGQHPEPVHYRFQPIEGEPFSVTIPWLQSGPSPGLLLVTTKAGDTLEALTSALPSTPPSTPIVLFQNGLGSQQQVAETWPEKARAKGAGFLQSGFGWGTLIAALIWFGLSSSLPMGQETWRLMFALGALPAFFVLYIRRGVEESEKWKQAVREKRWSATGAAGKGGSDKRPFTLSQLFREPEARRRTFVTLLLSVVTTVGWWAISSWLPTFTIGLAKEQGLANPAGWGSKITILYTVGAIVAYMAAGFIIDAIGRRRFLFLTFLGSLATTYVTYAMTTSVESMSVVAPVNGFFTLGCAYVWMAIYPAELFSSTVRSTACSFVFNAARLIAWVFPIIAGSLIHSFGGVANAALALGSVYVLGLVLPWFLPETQGEGLPH